MRNETYKQIRRTVMRRVYTAFAGRVVSSNALLYCALFATALAAFAHYVHIAKVLENMSTLSAAQVPGFAFNAVMRGEVFTLLAIGVMVFTALSVQWQLRGLFTAKLQPAT